MRIGPALFALLFPCALATACSNDSSSSGSETDGGATGDGGCLLTTPKEGDPCTAGQVLCNPGNLCCEGAWSCNTSTGKWSLLRGGCACTDAAPIDTGAGDTTGFDSGGRVPKEHRADDSQCAGAPAAGNCSSGGGGGAGECSKDGDCTTGTNGRCVENVGGGARICFCSYDTCSHDTDCPTGKLCVCHGSPYTAGGNTCSNGDCRVDTDCGTGGYCSPTRGGGCGGLTGYFCHTSSDTCLDDADCKTDGGGPRICAYSATSKHWECTEQMLCP